MEALGKLILIKPEGNPDKTSGGIIIPAVAKKSAPIGRVFKCGKGCVEVIEGDRVQYNPKNGSIVSIDDIEHHFVHEEAIFYVYGSDNE